MFPLNFKNSSLRRDKIRSSFSWGFANSSYDYSTKCRDEIILEKCNASKVIGSTKKDKVQKKNLFIICTHLKLIVIKISLPLELNNVLINVHIFILEDAFM